MNAVLATLGIREDDIHETFVRASGPGGQNVNKVSTAVELRYDVAASSLPAEVKKRLARLAGRRLSAGGVLRIDSRVHRTQAQNRAEARKRLFDLLQRAAVAPRSRKKGRPSPASRERRLAEKTRRGRVKAVRGRVRGED